jgi:hypothetical protein
LFVPQIIDTFAEKKIGMEAVRKILPASVISPLVELPWRSKDMRVEVIVMPVDETAATMRAPGKSLMGRLRAYANPELLEKEHTAWSDITAEKHGTL